MVSAPHTGEVRGSMAEEKRNAKSVMAKLVGRPFSERARHFSEQVGECLIWTGRLDSDGYGYVQIDKQRDFVHRAAWIEVNGSIPEGMSICHSCDNRACINPLHLFLGTHQANMDDRNQKLRQAQGSKNGRAKLSESQVAEIRTRLRSGCADGSVALSFGISRRVIRDIRTGKTWKHVA